MNAELELKRLDNKPAIQNAIRTDQHEEEFIESALDEFLIYLMSTHTRLSNDYIVTYQL